MLYDIWTVLGIEPTKDKKIIQQAYAEKLKIYHPEEAPEEFQHLQEAYHAAIEYAKGRSALSHAYSDVQKPVRKIKKAADSAEMFMESDIKKKRIVRQHKGIEEEIREELEKREAEEQKPEKEQIPEYIIELATADVHALKAEDIKKYVILLKNQLLKRKGKENLKELEYLFDTIQFRTVLDLEEFRICLRDEMMNVSKWNQTVIKFLLNKIQQIMREDAGQNLDELMRYLESKIKRKEIGKEYGIFLLCCIAVACFCLFVWGQIIGSNSYIKDHSPQADEVCQAVQEKYGMEIEAANVTISCLGNGDIKTAEKNPKVVKYDILFEDGDTEYSFTGTYFPREKSEITFDLECVLMKKYLEENLDCEFWEGDIFLYGEGFIIKPEMKCEEDKEEFVQQFSMIINELFSDPIMADSDYSFLIEINLEGVLDSVIITIDKSNYIEKCGMLSEKLEPILQESIIRRLYEEGVYSQDEYFEKIQNIKSKQ